MRPPKIETFDFSLQFLPTNQNHAPNMGNFADLFCSCFCVFFQQKKQQVSEVTSESHVYVKTLC